MLEINSEMPTQNTTHTPDLKKIKISVLFYIQIR